VVDIVRSYPKLGHPYKERAQGGYVVVDTLEKDGLGKHNVPQSANPQEDLFSFGCKLVWMINVNAKVDGLEQGRYFVQEFQIDDIGLLDWDTRVDAQYLDLLQTRKKLRK